MGFDYPYVLYPDFVQHAKLRKEYETKDLMFAGEMGHLIRLATH
jgi:hypothetical protein